MAELALVASIIQVADIGIRLSLRLYTFGETVASADQTVLNISKDVSLTSSVLKELGNTFENDKARVRSDNATKTAKDVVQECHKVFEEMDTLLLKKVPHLTMGSDVMSRARTLVERLKWPAIKGKIELLSCMLDKTKNTLTLMLNVIIYAQQISMRDQSSAGLTEQRQLIEVLAQVKQERERALMDAQRRLESFDLGNPSQALRPGIDAVEPPIGYQLTAVPTISQSKSTQIEGSKPKRSDTLDAQEDVAIRVLFQEHDKLRQSLFKEVYSMKYGIERRSRNRYQYQISSAYADEIGWIRSNYKPPSTLNSPVPPPWSSNHQRHSQMPPAMQPSMQARQMQAQMQARQMQYQGQAAQAQSQVNGQLGGQAQGQS